jgi:CIC family chloride channel protein
MTAAGTVGPRDTLRHAANVFARSGGLPLRVVAPDGTEEGHLLLQDILPAWLHDLNEATDRNRYLNTFARRPARRGVNRPASSSAPRQ